MPAAPDPAGQSAPPRSLAEELRARSDEELVALLHDRPDLATPLPSDLARLAERAATRASVLQVLDRLDRPALHVVEALAVLPDGVALDRVATLTGLDADRLTVELGRLAGLALVWRPSEDTDAAPRLVRAAADALGPHPAGLGPPVAVALAALPERRVERLGRDLGGPPALVLAATERIAELLADAGAEARAALTGLVWGPPTARLPDALREVDLDTARSPVEALLARGLLLPIALDVVALPREAALHLRGERLHRDVDAPVPPSEVLPTAEVDRAAAGAATDVVRHVDELLSAWAAQPAVVLRAGGLGVRELKRAVAATGLDAWATALVAESAHAAGLLGVGGGPGTGQDEGWLPTPAYDAWLHEPAAMRWAVLATAWLRTTRAPHLVDLGADRERGLALLGPDLERPALPDLRHEVLSVLAGGPAGTVWTEADVVARLDWDRPRRAGAARTALVRATLHEAALLGVVARGALSSAGRALLGAADGSPGSGSAAVAAALAPALPALLDHVLLQADLTAVAPGPLTPALAQEMALIADLESTGGASVYRFRESSIRRAMDAGRTAAEVLDLLAGVSRTPVPQPLTYLVEDVARRHGGLRVGAAASFVRSDDVAALTELEADPRAAALMLRRLAPTVLAAQVDPETLVARLRALGHLPVVEAVDGEVVLARAAARRANPRPAPHPVRLGRQPLELAARQAAVRALRAGDRTRSARPMGELPRLPGHAGYARLLAQLRSGADEGATLAIAYLDRDGTSSQRVVDPIAVGGGWLTAYDHRSQQVRTFALHRIAGVAAIEDVPENVTEDVRS